MSAHSGLMRHRRRAARLLPAWLLWSVGAVAAGAVVTGVVVLLASSASEPPAAAARDRAELQAYASALRGPTAAGGEVVAREMQPSIRELRAGQVDGATFAVRARGWQLALQRVHQRIDALASPVAAAAARPLFESAIDGYVAAAALFEKAGMAGGTARSDLLDRGVGVARSADTAYDRAAAVVQDALRREGLPPDPALPNPS